MNLHKIILTSLAILLSAGVAAADGSKDDVEVVNKYRVGADVEIKLAKGLELNLAPELRYKDGYDKMVIDAGLSYKTWGCITWGATYRLVADRQENSDYIYSPSSFFGSNKYETETYGYYALDVTYKEKFGRFTPSFRVRYNNFTDEEIDDEAYLRYRLKCNYDIPKCKITPYVAIEAHQELSENIVDKVRYATGLDLKVSKTTAISFDYKLDLFMLKYKNVNIFSVGYNYKF